MSESLLRREIKKAIDRLPADRLSSLADYVAFLDSPTMRQRIEQAERDLKADKGVNWREVRDAEPGAGHNRSLNRQGPRYALSFGPPWKFVFLA